MKKSGIYLILFFIHSFDGLSQTSNKFFTMQGTETDSLNSYFYQVWNEKDSDINYTYYTSTNSTRSKEVKINGDLKNGMTRKTFYYLGGEIKAEGDFHYSSPKGYLESYYKNGKKKSELFYRNYEPGLDKDLIVEIVNYWDSLGTLLIKEGEGWCYCNLFPYADTENFESGLVKKKLKEGEWRGIIANGEGSYAEVYKNGLLEKGELNYENQKYFYTQLEVPSLPKGGIEGFYRMIGSRIKYPKTARRKNIEGRVFVEFLIFEDGSLGDVRVAKGIGGGCDEEAIRVVSLSPPWNPGLQRGKPVKQRMVLPLTFKLR